MPSPFTQAGAQADPSHSAPLHTNRFFTGLWTQRSPLRDAATPYLYEKFYSASRFDSLIGGINTEITARLTLARRPGSSVYNSTATLPQCNRLTPFRTFVNGVEKIRVIGDFAPDGVNLYGSVRDVTGPATNIVIWAKLAGSGRTSFQAVGTELFFVDGVSQNKLITSTLSWTSVTTLTAGSWIVDANNNIQLVSVGGMTGATLPAFAAVFGALTVDGAVTWMCKGSATSPIGLLGPQVQPGVYWAALSSLIPVYAPNTWYSPIAATVDKYGYIQILTTAGVTDPTYSHATGGTPVFATTPGATTTDGTCVWTCQGANAWSASTAYAAGHIYVAAGYMYQVIVAGVSGSAAPPWTPAFGTQTVDGGIVWQCFGPADVRYSYNFGLSSTGTLSDTTTGLARGFNTQIIDSNGYLQTIVTPGQSGTAAPVWSMVLGAQTQATYDAGYSADVNCYWINAGTAGNAGTAPWLYAYAWRDSITGHVTTASPMSAQIVAGFGGYIIAQGLTSANPQYDQVIVYRTEQGGAILFQLALFAATGAGVLWTYKDQNPDSSLNLLIQAQINLSNNPPPSNLSTLAYHLGRLFGFANNVLYYSGGPVTLSGSGNEAWPPLQSYVYPSKGVLAWPSSIGLIVFTQSDVFVVLGQGNTSSPLYTTIFQSGVGLLNADSFAVNGSTAYLLTTAYRCISFDPSAGETEVGFPVGDLINFAYGGGTGGGNYPSMAYHEGSSADTALYLADGLFGWLRLSSVSAPESGQVWSPRALFGNTTTGLLTGVTSIEVTPGVKRLILQMGNGGPLLYRDATVSADNGAAFSANAIIGSIVLAQPGQIASPEFITTDSLPLGTRATMGVLMGEIGDLNAAISGTPGNGVTFDVLQRSRQDPTLLPPAKTIHGDRCYLSQNGTPAWCRHIQVNIQWPVEAAANELLSYTIFGEIKNEQEAA